MTRSAIGHVAISASAGSGKTFQLAHRYIRLMANGVDPARIIALTFSRKAAGEIFDSIVNYLCDASGSPQKARRTAQLIGEPGFAQQGFLQLLRDLLVSIHSLHISTLDSFTVGILRSFPMELGIPSAFQIMDNDSAEAKAASRTVLGMLFSHRHVSSEAQRSFLDAFRQATFGQEQKGLEQSLDNFITRFGGFYRLMPQPQSWGQEATIWPRGSPWLEPAGGVAQAAAELRTSLVGCGLPDSLVENLTSVIDFCAGYGGSSRWDEGLSGKPLFRSLAGNLQPVQHGEMTLSYNKGQYVLGGRQCQLLSTLLRHAVGTELRAMLNRTRGIYQVLRQYEQFYDGMVRRRGKLTFIDAQYLLTSANQYSSGSVLSRLAGQDSRLYIDYRLDCRLDHWLLDEFQDTSDLQWEVLRNLADEILQDAGGGRSFFYVGDVKQAIYGWRGGNARLFGKILEQYQGQIEQIPLSVSFRSSQPVIDAVNRVFSGLSEGQLPPDAVAQWQKVWQDHRCQADVVPGQGYAALLEPPCHAGEYKPTKEDRYHLVATLLNEMRPLERGLSVAILVRKNATGKETVGLLRGECPGMTFIHEGRAAIKDNPVVSALLALVRFAAHPGDTLAWRHLQMSPLNKHFAKHGLGRDRLPLMLLTEIQTHGFRAFIRNWGAHLSAAHHLDDFGSKRLNDLIEAAGEFDRTGGSSCNDFLHFIDSYQLHELAAENSVRVMTIHQSKGLGFDVVILPDLQGDSMVRAANLDFLIARDPETDRPLWAMKMPPRTIAESEPTLAQQVQVRDEIECFDGLCLLYVALTRAKQGLYMITGFPGRSSRMVTPAALLKTRLAGEPNPAGGTALEIGGEEFTCLYETGERDWYLKAPPGARPAGPARKPQLSREYSRYPSLRRRLLGVSPSAIEAREIRADLLFTHVAHDSIELGRAIHELFQRVSWIDGTD
ncbi:MAG: UvrD-helicase domain-containing protein, partial [Dehalococcoidia bacterium]